MARRTNKLLTREREIELASSIENAQRTLAETVTGSMPALRALCQVLEQAKQGPAEAAELFLGIGDDWSEAEQALDDLLTAGRRLQSQKPPTEEQAVARATIVRALSQVRLSRHAIDRVVGELEARLQSVRKGSEALGRTIATLRTCQETYENAKAAFVRANMGLVFAMANKRTHPNLSLYDLVQEGSMGLMRAIDKFDHRRGIKFVTYAGWWIRHAINRALSDQARTIRIPVHMLDARYRVRRVAEQLRRGAVPEPTDAELAQRAGISLDKVKMLASLPPEPMSLDAPVFDDGEGRLADVIPDRGSSSPIDLIAATQAQVRLRRLLKSLTPREEEVIRLRFGIDRPDALALEEIGQRFAVSRERIRQIEAEALDKLHRHATSEQLDSLLS
jgi:RNA polymerase primary sigma factor